jgi:perosamine synthetase
LLNIKVPIIEDCAQAIGGSYHDKPLGSFGQAAVFSFYATKVMTTGEGGMVVSNSKKFIERTRNLREYDKSVDYKIRYNYKMTDIQAAIGLAQLNQLETFVQRRRSIAQNYSTAFSSLGMQLPTEDPEHIYYRYVVDLGSDTSPWQRSLLAKGVACAPPVHPPLHIYLRESGFPETEKAWKQRISIPIYPSLSDEEMDRVIQSFIQTCEEVENA